MDWPLFALTVRTPRLELRYPDDADLQEVAGLADGGIHDAGYMPFSVPWTRQTGVALRRGTLQWNWRSRAEWTPEHWNFNPVVVVDDRIVGVQGMNADNFAVARTVSTGSWLGREHQGRGIGTEMRSAILHLAFAGLGAWAAHSAARDDNDASMAVTKKLGYRPNGEELASFDGERVRLLSYRMTREDWQARRRDDIVISGLEPCLDLFGADGSV
ncbi:MAG TPA: GNAT family protein [Acidimicrobiales bacterium]|nr:GNAT family protein [Acidimicrobiales bacterium]